MKLFSFLKPLWSLIMAKKAAKKKTAKKTKKARAKTYVAKAGDTLIGIAEKHGIGPRPIILANRENRRALKNIVKGMKIKLPPKKGDKK